MKSFFAEKLNPKSGPKAGLQKLVSGQLLCGRLGIAFPWPVNLATEVGNPWAQNSLGDSMSG